MITKKLPADKNGIAEAGEILKNGGIVGIPTETVYGLAANALNETAVKNIFIAKGRPQDNPLIVHISNLDMLQNLVAEFPEKAKLCVEKFWPGPITIILPKSNIIPNSVCAGLNSVAIRMPGSKTARDIITAAGVPLAAPSANISGSPSPTSANHVLFDLNGKIDAVVMGENCEIGVESTVISFAVNPPRLLRPGGITAEQLKQIIPDLCIDKAVLSQLESNEKAASPGMKYKHYSPKARIILVEADKDKFTEFVNSKAEINNSIYALIFEEDKQNIKLPYLIYGSQNNGSSQAGKLFDCLRKLDELNCSVCYAHAPQKSGVGLAVYNRLIRAAAFEVIKL